MALSAAQKAEGNAIAAALQKGYSTANPTGYVIDPSTIIVADNVDGATVTVARIIASLKDMAANG